MAQETWDMAQRSRFLSAPHSPMPSRINSPLWAFTPTTTSTSTWAIQDALNTNPAIRTMTTPSPLSVCTPSPQLARISAASDSQPRTLPAPSLLKSPFLVEPATITVIGAQCCVLNKFHFVLRRELPDWEANVLYRGRPGGLNWSLINHAIEIPLGVYSSSSMPLLLFKKEEG